MAKTCPECGAPLLTKKEKKEGWSLTEVCPHGVPNDGMSECSDCNDEYELSD